jgi:hypothetical protein
MVSDELLWCPMNYYRDDELNYRDGELNNGYVINFIHFKKIQQHQLSLFLGAYDAAKSSGGETEPKRSEPVQPKPPAGNEDIKRMPVVNKVSQLPTTSGAALIDIKSEVGSNRVGRTSILCLLFAQLNSL